MADAQAEAAAKAEAPAVKQEDDFAAKAQGADVKRERDAEADADVPATAARSDTDGANAGDVNAAQLQTTEAAQPGDAQEQTQHAASDVAADADDPFNLSSLLPQQKDASVQESEADVQKEQKCAAARCRVLSKQC